MAASSSKMLHIARKTSRPQNNHETENKISKTIPEDQPFWEDDPKYQQKKSGWNMLFHHKPQTKPVSLSKKALIQFATSWLSWFIMVYPDIIFSVRIPKTVAQTIRKPLFDCWYTLPAKDPLRIKCRCKLFEHLYLREILDQRVKSVGLDLWP